ncbi:MAG: hypothetical protein JWQ65_2587 [Devosia sp.]|nr:hypothetical protein [Devosia sp.]
MGIIQFGPAEDVQPLARHIKIVIVPLDKPLLSNNHNVDERQWTVGDLLGPTEQRLPVRRGLRPPIGD